MHRELKVYKDAVGLAAVPLWRWITLQSLIHKVFVKGHVLSVSYISWGKPVGAAGRGKNILPPNDIKLNHTN